MDTNGREVDVALAIYFPSVLYWKVRTMAMKNFHKTYKEQVLHLADEMRNQPLPEPTEELFALFETTGNRIKYEEVYFGRRKFLAVFGMAAMIFGRDEDVAKLEEIILSVCDEECWALPAHVNRRDDKNWRTTVDLFASETAQTLAEIVSLVNENERKLPKELCERVHTEIERRVFTPFFSSKPNYGCWECAGHNWNAVCAGGIGSACLYLMAGKEEERLQKCLDRLCNSLTYYLDGFEEDGACMEGIGYFTYGMTYFVGFAEQLYRYSNGKTDLFDNEKLKKIAQFQQKMYFGCGQTISFSDGEMHARFRMGLTRFLAEKYDGVRVPNEALAADFETDTCYRFMGLCRDYLWTKNMEHAVGSGTNTVNGTEEMVTEKTAKKESAFTVRHDILPSAQWSICESANGVGMAIKGGNNAEPHNHNDVGSFLYIVGGEQLVTDLGAGEYTKDYFGADRYEILCNSSMGHSVPLPNGKIQQNGEWHRATAFEADGKGNTKINFSAAYPIGNIRHLERETRFSLEDGSLLVTDTFEMPIRSARFIEQVVTQGEVTVEWHPEGESIVKIKKGNAECVLTFPKEIHHLYCMEQEHSNHEGEKEIVRLIRWDAFLKRGERTSTWFKIAPTVK